MVRGGIKPLTFRFSGVAITQLTHWDLEVEGCRPYDLRHAALSLWLNAGVPATEVAKRAGHSVEVLHRVYAKCMKGQQERMNGKISSALDD